MPVIQNISSIYGAPRIRGPAPASSGIKPYLPVDDGSAIDFRRARSRLLNLYRKLEELAELANIQTRFKLDLPDARSASGLGLDLTHTAAALSSVDEINASPMSFSPFGPEWNGSSTAAITIGGEYEGDQGSGTLSFRVTGAGTHGDDNLRIRVDDPDGNRIRNLNIRKNHAEDRQYSIGNGLYLTLGPGSLTNGNTTTIQVYDNVGAAVDPAKPLGGIRNDNPNLQFGATPVADGSFLLNGETISVATTDSINDVIARINASNAGVTANFNAVTERLDFLQDTLGSVPTIDLQNDTSNFLAAAKLAGSAVTPGIDPEDQKSLNEVGAFDSVQDGSILINGRQIAIDTANDSLATIIGRINASPADVVASFDPNTQKVVIEARDASGTLELDSNGTGFFPALNMIEGRVDPEALSRGVSRGRSYQIADAVTAAFAELGVLFRDSSFLQRGANASRFRSPLESALRGTAGNELTGDLFGLKFDGSAAARLRGDFASIDRRELTENLQRRGDAVRDLLTNRDGTAGLVPDLLRATRQALINVNDALGLSGTFIDTFA